MIEAVVQVGALETRYLRCGRGGRTVVVLTVDHEADLPAIARLAADHRVIIPVPPLPLLEGGALEWWLRGLIEGLGLEQPLVMLSPALRALAPRLLDGCGDVIDCVVPESAGPHG